MQRKYDDDIDSILTDAAKRATEELDQILGDGIGARVKDAQTRQAISALQSTLSYLWRSVGDLTKAGQRDAASTAVDQSFSWDSVLLRKAIKDDEARAEFQRNLEQAAERNVEAAVARVYKSHIPLSQQVYKTEALASGWVDRLVTRGIARGQTVKELQRDVREFIRPEVKGGVSYAAKRLSRTEINNAYHAVTIVHNEEKPWVTGMAWRLSGSHPRPDICNVYAKKAPYPKEQVPEKPHPNCLCTTYPETVTNQEFYRALAAGEYAAWFDTVRF